MDANKIYVAMRCAEDGFILLDNNGNYGRPKGNVIAVSHDIDALKKACYLDVLHDGIASLRERWPTLSDALGGGNWRICKGTTDCHLFIDCFKDVEFAIFPVSLVGQT